MSANHAYHPISHRDDDSDEVGASELSHHPLEGEPTGHANSESVPLVQGSTASQPSGSNPAVLAAVNDEDSDKEGEDLGHPTPGYSGSANRYQRLHGTDQNHPLANYDLDEDIYADAEEEIVVAGPSERTDGPQSYPIGSRPGMQSNDGVFANIPAKPVGKNDDEEKQAEMPPPYEEIAQDASPPYFDTTVIATGDDPDEILVEGLGVGGGFSFFWNMLVSMSFQFVGFVLTYLLHTTHAAKNGSRAGLGVTFIQYGLYMRTKEFHDSELEYYEGMSASEIQAEMDAQASKNVWISYFLMILGWFIIIRSIGEYVRVRRMLAAYLYSPEVQV